MKRLLLIDDEFMARQHIKEAFPWEEWGYTIVGEATNGVEAQAAVEALDPDIALIDITMPVMDGLTLLKHMNTRFPHTKCVILTAHREFSYINQAMQNGAVGYILKSPINLTETKAALDKALKESEKDSQILSASQNRKTIQSNSYPLRKHFFQQLLTGLYVNDDEITQRANDIGAQLKFASFLLLTVEVDGLAGVYSLYSNNDRMLIEFSMLEIIRESLLELLPVKIEIFPLEFGRLTLMVCTNEKQLDKESCMEICLRLEQAIQPQLEKYLDVTVKLAASEGFYRPSQIRTMFRQTEGLFIYRFYQEKPRTIVTYGLRPFRQMSSDQWDALLTMTAPLEEVRPHEFHVKTMDKIQSYLIQMNPCPTDVINWFISLQVSLNKAAYLSEWPDFQQAAYLGEATKLLLAWLQKRDRVAGEAIAVRPEIARAIQYIRHHLGDELTVDAISAESGFSTSHFSHIFKKEVGMSVIDYVLEQRIELAKKYLSEGKFRNYELSEKVGFQHYSYFSNIFKKMTGVSPNEYKRSMKNVITQSE
ncbi:response regulator transcription factor [Paenibacillus alba]|uniref:Response regulator n=1 Tax=Paenibacillus alba TaxID=1197127 RepID=A0ABU6G7Y3_9BACL|nr:response regulator [Paenibacillus alba]MEC0230272.1 response regulator [Paenibacillus alba]